MPDSDIVPEWVLCLPFYCVALGSLLDVSDPQASFTQHTQGAIRRSVLHWVETCRRLLEVGLVSINHGNKCTSPCSKGLISALLSVKSIGLIFNNNPLKGTLVTQRISATLITNYFLNC